MKERYSREIINNFPYPIASIFIRLRTDECLDPGFLRLKYILATAEAITRFCGIVVLCECREKLGKGEVPPHSLSSNFSQMFKRPAWGSWMNIAREGLKWLKEEDTSLICSEIIDFWLKAKNKPTDAAQALGNLLTIRNHLSHDKIKAMHRQHFNKLCETTYPLLEEALEALDFLLDYELAFVSHIEVHKRRKSPPKFWHKFKMIKGHSDDFYGERDTLPQFMESDVILFRNIESSAYLNLHPFFVYEETEGKAPDIFFYNGMKNPKSVDYSACKHGGSFNSKAHPQAQEIAEDLEQLMSFFKTS